MQFNFVAPVIKLHQRTNISLLDRENDFTPKRHRKKTSYCYERFNSGEGYAQAKL